MPPAAEAPARSAPATPLPLQSTLQPLRPVHVALSGVGLHYDGGVRALERVDLDLREGDFCSIVGPSGCGKSTLLRLIAGLLEATAGAIEVHGAPVHRGARPADVAFVFQQPTLLPWRTVEANVRLPLELRWQTREAKDRIAEVLELVGLSQFAGFFPHQLSGGMQMRVSLARALVTGPRLLLLDEPFAALDDITRQRLNEELLALWERDRFTALFVTHNVSEAVFLSQRVVVMSPRPGTIREDVVIPFTGPRRFELRADAEFARLTGEVGALLRSVHE